MINGAFQKISLQLLDPSPTQPRKYFSEKGHEELTASMRKHGFFGALLVRPKTDGRFEIVTGERRARAAKASTCIAEVSCEVRELSDVEVITLQLIENLQRDDLNPIEQSAGFNDMLALQE